MGLERNNLAVVVEDFAQNYQTGDVEHLADRLDPDVTWQGVEPGMMCHNRDEVMSVFRSQAKETFRLEQIEVIDGGDRVVLCLRSVDAADPSQRALIFQVFTFDGTLIVRMQDYETRDEALHAAGVASQAEWG
jgi:SnoaL-like domain